jgi:hypothetical protein
MELLFSLKEPIKMKIYTSMVTTSRKKLSSTPMEDTPRVYMKK